MNKPTIFSASVSLLIWLVAGYVIWGTTDKPVPQAQVMSSSNGMMHQMPDGSMMEGNNNGMQGTMDSMMAGFNGKTGDAFDKEFLAEMIVHHQGAVVMAEAVFKTSKRPELIKLANGIISAQTGEISMMKNWQSAWFSIKN